jgi:glycosyltransferase involved in cell wall biosynthesis
MNLHNPSPDPNGRRFRILFLDPAIVAEWAPLPSLADVSALPVPGASYLLHEASSPGTVDPEVCFELARTHMGRFDFILGECTGGFLWRAIFRLVGDRTPFLLIPRFNHVVGPNAFALLLAAQLRHPGDTIFAGSLAAHLPFSRFGFASEPLYLPGLDLKTFRPLAASKQELREALGLSTGSPLLLFVGRVEDDKNVLELLEIFQAVRATTGAELVICHQFDREGYLGQCREKAAAIGGVHWVRKPVTANLVRYYNAADLFVSAAVSLFETFGRAPVEAQACGTPPVVADYDGFRETVTANTGFRIPTLPRGPLKGPDVAGFSRTLLNALADAPGRAERGRAGVEHVQQFAQETAIQGLISRLPEAMSRGCGNQHQRREVALADAPEEVRALWPSLEGRPIEELVRDFLIERKVPVPSSSESVAEFLRRWFAHY